MNEEQKEWSYQYSSNVRAQEFVRLSCAMTIWILFGTGISLALDLASYSWGSAILGIFVIAMFIFPFIAHKSKPGYLFIRKISGHENLPKEPYPRSTVKMYREPRSWWAYLPGLWFSLMTLLALFFAIRYLLK